MYTYVWEYTYTYVYVWGNAILFSPVLPIKGRKWPENFNFDMLVTLNPQINEGLKAMCPTVYKT